MAMSTRERIEKKSMPVPWTGCWLWLGAHDRDGYGHIWRDGYSRPAHRVAYEVFIGPIPDGFHIDHLCRVRCCVNPDHLEPVTCKENLMRGDTAAARLSKQTHCKRGHELSGRNLILQHGKNRKCRQCGNEAAIAAYYRKKERVRP